MAKKTKSAAALEAEIREFVGAHPEGWGHGEWAGLLEGLRAGGFEVTDEAAIGAMVERARLELVLGKVKNVGPQRLKVIVDRYETIWSLRGAEVDELAATTKIPRVVAERIKQSV
jgi:hypothetical protein